MCWLLFVHLIWRNFYLVICPFLYWVICLFINKLYMFFICLDTNPLPIKGYLWFADNLLLVIAYLLLFYDAFGSAFLKILMKFSYDFFFLLVPLDFIGMSNKTLAYWTVYGFFVAAVTNCYKFNDFKQFRCTIFKFWKVTSLKSLGLNWDVQMAEFLSGGCKEESISWILLSQRHVMDGRFSYYITWHWLSCLRLSLVRKLAITLGPLR